MESKWASVAPWLLVLSILLNSFVSVIGITTKEVAMESINRSVKSVGRFMSKVVVSTLNSVWAVLTSLVAGICLLA